MFGSFTTEDCASAIKVRGWSVNGGCLVVVSARVPLGIFATEEVYLTNRRDVRPLAVTSLQCSYERDKL